MAILRRKQPQPDDPRPAIAQFWEWWAANRAEVLAAADAGDDDRAAALLGPAVAAIDPDLAAEIVPGTDGRRRVVVSSGGRPALRSVAERWYLAAPAPDDAVEYASVRERDSGSLSDTITVEGFDLPKAEFVAATRVDPQRQRLDLVVHHPLFPLIDQQARHDVAMQAVRASLGDDDVERWLGVVEVAADEPLDAVAVSALPAVVEQMRPSGNLWALLKGKSARGPVVATVRRPFNRADRPLCDTHVAVRLSFPKRADGLPANDDITAAIQRLQQQIAAELGGDGPQVAVIGHEISGGFAVIHLYVDGLEVDPKRAKPVLAEWEYGTARLRSQPDPAWRGVTHLLS